MYKGLATHTCNLNEFLDNFGVVPQTSCADGHAFEALEKVNAYLRVLTQNLLTVLWEIETWLAVDILLRNNKLLAYNAPLDPQLCD